MEAIFGRWEDKEIDINDSFSILDIDVKIDKLAGEFMNKYQKSHNIAINDALIAASTKVHGLRLWTLNKKHYPMLEKDDFLA